MKPLIKWPGGKSRELKIIKQYLPNDFDPKISTYIEPFLGGGAVYFSLFPTKAHLNDLDQDLYEFYNAIKNQDSEFYSKLNTISCDWETIDILVDELTKIFDESISNLLHDSSTHSESNILNICKKIEDNFNFKSLEFIKSNNELFEQNLTKFLKLKIKTIIRLDKKHDLDDDNITDLLETAIRSAYYTFIRDIYNYQENSTRTSSFYFIREFCFGSMFRFNNNGEFNIPYGGMNYNNKDFNRKVQRLKDPKLVRKFQNGTSFYNSDFKEFFDNLNKNDVIDENSFIFFDPPYDTEFSDYSAHPFTKKDQERLASLFSELKGNAMLIIKETDFIKSLYSDLEGVRLHNYSKSYTYNVKGRNNREANHLIITNYDVNPNHE